MSSICEGCRNPDKRLTAGILYAIYRIPVQVCLKPPLHLNIDQNIPCYDLILFIIFKTSFYI